ncbi:Crp/Fnr family transcriptional regulator [Salipaludibacillus aurantiacus]|uniref:cAMP-binding domain of CRP or a regulatory subunit of cAMP-dependent protein kinases n=1 Tax=Salipaludibacillus aurantiacus TaxID=1601833 RepID=A0A1H9WZ02_9BACI|nr:Crp/Fnr family transcriptional regulator [Salipaludibacillus aurantiacus]SES38887.1 cAMP-binding domain of CRP or a regulatory subunit of cAMP-dependent protein kinases [Salipaludibacillus aurantiacus]
MKTNLSCKDIKKFDIFSMLTNEGCKKIIDYAYIRSYRKGQMLFTEGDPRERLYFLLDGYIRLERIDIEGDVHPFNYVKPFQMFPEGGLFQDTNYAHSAVAVTNVNIFYIPAEILESLIKLNSKQMIQVIRHLSSLLIAQELRLQSLQNLDACRRVEQTIAHLGSHLGQETADGILIPCPFTMNDLANFSGTSRETVCHSINGLKAQKVISIHSKLITIHRPDYFTGKESDTSEFLLSSFS